MLVGTLTVSGSLPTSVVKASDSLDTALIIDAEEVDYGEEPTTEASTTEEEVISGDSTEEDVVEGEIKETSTEEEFLEKLLDEPELLEEEPLLLTEAGQVEINSQEDWNSNIGLGVNLNVNCDIVISDTEMPGAIAIDMNGHKLTSASGEALLSGTGSVSIVNAIISTKIKSSLSSFTLDTVSLVSPVEVSGSLSLKNTLVNKADSIICSNASSISFSNCSFSETTSLISGDEVESISFDGGRISPVGENPFINLTKGTHNLSVKNSEVDFTDYSSSFYHVPSYAVLLKSLIIDNIEAKEGKTSFITLYNTTGSPAFNSVRIENSNFNNWNSNVFTIIATMGAIIDGCTFSHKDNSNEDIAVNFSHNPSSTSCINSSISDFNQGFSYSYAGGVNKIDNCSTDDVHLGVEMKYTSSGTSLEISDSSIVGDKKEGSVGISSEYGFSSADKYTGLGNFYATNTEIKDFEEGIFTNAASFGIEDCSITDCTVGVDNKNTFICLRSNISMTDNYGVNSSLEKVGISGSHSVAFFIASSDIVGYPIGVENTSGSLYVVNSNVDASDLGIDGFSASIVNSKIITKGDGIISKAWTSLADCDIKGVGTGNGIDGDGTVSIFRHNEGNKGNYVSYDIVKALVDYSKDEYMNITPNIENFDVGVVVNNAVNLEDVKVHDCNTCVKHPKGALIGNPLTINKNVYLYNADIGLDGSWVITNSTLNIHDCDIGVHTNETSSYYESGVNDKVTYMFDISDCGVGINAKSPGPVFVDGVTAKVYNCSSDGVQLFINGPGESVTLDAYNNGGYNLTTVDEDGTEYVIDYLTIIETPESYYQSNKGNNANISANNVRFRSTDFTTDDGFYLIHKNTQVEFSEAEIGWLTGQLTFKLEEDDYKKGRVIATANEANADYLLDNRLFIDKEGWVLIKGEPQDSKIPIVLAEGCNVYYDYKTNGGDSFEGEFNKVSVIKGDSADLSVEASKEGYEFIGWNTNKDATSGLDELTVEESNVTLYAIYKKTATITYHNWDSTSFDSVIFYNNENQKPYGLSNANVISSYRFVGYSLDKSDTSRIVSPNSVVVVPNDGLDVYSVYDAEGELIYKDSDGTVLFSDVVSNLYVAEDIVNYSFKYSVSNYPTKRGYRFNGWLKEDKTYNPNDLIETDTNELVLIADVSPILVDSIVVSPKQTSLTVSGTVKLIATILPEDALNKDVEWYSSDPSIATVDENGLVTGLKVGEVRIYAKTKDGSNLEDYAVIKIEPSVTSKNDVPKTGDKAPVVPLVLTSAFGVLAALFTSRKKKTK